MSKVLTFSRQFPAYHPKKGERTYFVEQFWNSFNVEYLDQEFYMDYEDDIKFKLNKNIPFADITNFFSCLGRRSGLGKKSHTIRSGNRWKEGDKFSPRVWSGKPYNSKMITIAPDIEIKKVWDFEIKDCEDGILWLECEVITKSKLEVIAQNDGLSLEDLLYWFKYPNDFKGQIISWSDKVQY